MLRLILHCATLALFLGFVSRINLIMIDSGYESRENQQIVTGNLTIILQPTDQTDCKGNKATFSVVAEGGIGTVHYLWKRKRTVDASLVSFGARDSMKLPVYNIGVGSEAPDGTQYQVTVSDQNGVVTSGIATLFVNQITGIAPVGVATYTRNEGDNLWFKVQSSGNAPSFYQWIKKEESGVWRDISDNSIISGSQLEQLNFFKLSVADSGIYKVRVTFPTMNGNHCTETSSISRKVIVIKDIYPPLFFGLNDVNQLVCPDDIIMAEWNDSLSDIVPKSCSDFILPRQSNFFNLSSSNFSDNVTPSADLILHWGIFSSGNPVTPIRDEAGNLLDDKIGQISRHNEIIDFENKSDENKNYRIVFWLEDGAGNLTPDSLRHTIHLTIPKRPEIISDF